MAASKIRQKEPVKITGIKKMVLHGLGIFSKKFNSADWIVKRLIHIYAIGIGGRCTRGSLCIITRPDGKLLLVETVYKRGKGFVGGLPTSRQEQSLSTMLREISEEIGLHLQSEPQLIGLYRQKNINHLDAVFTHQLSTDEVQRMQKVDGEIDVTSWHPLTEAPAHLDEDGQEILAMFTSWQEARHQSQL